MFATRWSGAARGSRRRGVTTLVVFTSATLTLSACRDRLPTDASSDELSSGETQLVVGQLVDVLGDALDLVDVPPLAVGPPVAGPVRTPYGELHDDVISFFRDCPGFGLVGIEASIDGDVDESAGTADLTVSAAVTFSGCVVHDDLVYITLQADPGIAISAEIVIVDGTAEITIHGAGDVAWSADDDRSGSCTVDLMIETATPAGGGSDALSGSVCGSDASLLEIGLFG